MSSKLDPMTYEWPESVPEGWFEIADTMTFATKVDGVLFITPGDGGSLGLWHKGALEAEEVSVIGSKTPWKQKVYDAERNHYLGKRAEAQEALSPPEYYQRWCNDVVVQSTEYDIERRFYALLTYLAPMDVEIQQLRDRVAALEAKQ